MNYSWWWLLGFVALVTLLAIGLTLDPTRVRSPLIDQPLPAFTAEQLLHEGEPFEASQLQGGWSLLNVWASWCVSCLEEHPLLLEWAPQLAIYGINHRDHRTDAQAWLQKHGNPYRASVFDPNGEVGIEFGVYKVPESFLIDPQGVIRYKHIGALTREAWEREIRPRLQGGR